jgi:anaphase-promoting complex subunit 1
LTAGILGGFDVTPDTLKDEAENSTKPLKSVPATETVVWVSYRGPEANDDVLVTVDADKHQLSIWRYVYIKPKDTPLPLGRSKMHKRSLSRKRASMSAGNRRQSMATEFFDQKERLSPLSPGIREVGKSPTPEFPGAPPFSALPGKPPALSTTTTMASLVTGSSSQWSAYDNGRRDSLSRNDLSVTMDRMVLGGRLEVDAALAPVEHGRMKAAYWMEKLHSQEISEAE